MCEHLPAESPHRDNPDLERFPGTIPHASAYAQGGFLHVIAYSQRIHRKVIETLHEVTLRAVSALHDDGGELSRMRRYSMLCSQVGIAVKETPYWENLANLLETADDMLRSEIEDYREALTKRLAWAEDA